MRSIITSLLLLIGLAAHAQINPANQIAWPTGSAGCVYAPATNTCVANGGGGVAPNPLNVSNLVAPGEVVSTYQEQIFIPASGTVTVADLKTSGTVVGFTIGGCPGTTSCTGAGNWSADTTLNFYYDGAGSPQLTYLASTLGGAWQGSNTVFTAQRISSVIANNATGQGGVYFYYPMYFSSEWKMTVSASSALTNGETVWLTIWYTTAYTNTLRLYGAGSNSETVNLSSSTYTFLNTTGTGIIAGFFISTNTATDFTYSEANVQTYLDGASAITQALPASGGSGAGCSVGDILGVTQAGGSDGEVMVLAVSSGVVNALAPVIGNQGTGYSTASGLATTAISTTCTTLPTIYISTASNANDSMEGYTNQSLDFGTTTTREGPYGFVSAHGASGNAEGYTVFWDILDGQKGNPYSTSAEVIWQPDPIKQAVITNHSVTFQYLLLYYQ